MQKNSNTVPPQPTFLMFRERSSSPSRSLHHTRPHGVQPPRIAMMDTLFLALGELLQQEISAEQLLQHMVDFIAELIQADRGTIFLLNEPKQELVSVIAHLPEIEQIRVPLSQGIAGYVARTGKTVNIPFCDEDARFWNRVDQQTGYKTRSVLAAPLKDKHKRLIGIIQFLNKKDEGIFTKADETQLLRLAKQAARFIAQTTLVQGPSYLPPNHEEEENHSLSATQDPAPNLPIRSQINGIVGSSPAMVEVFQSVRKVAATEANVLLRGESGTGKTLIARAIHRNSPRRKRPFVQVNCTTLPEGLMENELFGHERGAYTGAHKRKPGKVEAAHRGTLFLDEIGDLPLHLQGKLLTLLQERTYYRVGGNHQIQANIRILTATNRPLEQLVSEGKFRRDLYYRLRVVQIELPPLRQRGEEDLTRLINHFVAQAAKQHKRKVHQIHPNALRMLLDHPWPGNVRELENCLESAVIFCENQILPQHLPLPRTPSVIHSTVQNLVDSGQIGVILPDRASPFDDEPTLAKLEARYIQHLLKKYDGNRSQCARILNIGRNTLYRKIQQIQAQDETKKA